VQNSFSCTAVSLAYNLTHPILIISKVKKSAFGVKVFLKPSLTLSTK